MIVMGLLQIFRRAPVQDALVALGTVATVIAVMAWLGPSLRPLGNWNLLVFFVDGVGAMVLLGVPIAFGLATFAYLSLTASTPPSWSSGEWTKARGI